MNEEIILEKFSKRFSQTVKSSNIDIPRLAEMLGIKSKSTIYRYMNGEMAPKIPMVKYAAEIFNVNPLWLMGLDVPMEKEIPYSAIYDFSTEKERSILSSAICYAIQNHLSKSEIKENTTILQLLDRLDSLSQNQALDFIIGIAEKNKNNNTFNLAKYIDSLQYSAKSTNEDTPEIRAIARDIAKLNPEKKELFKNLLKQMSNEADKK